MATETATTQKPIPKSGRYNAQVRAIFTQTVVTKQYGPKEKLDVVFDLLGTDRGDGQPFSVTQSVWKSENIFWKGQEGKLTGKSQAEFFKVFFGTPKKPVKFADIDLDALKGCYSDLFVKPEKYTNRDGIECKKASIGDIMEPEDEEQAKFNEDRRELFYKDAA